MMDDEIRENDELPLNDDILDAIGDDDAVDDLEIDPLAKKKKDLIDPDVESVDDLIEEEEGDPEIDSFDDKDPDSGY